MATWTYENDRRNGTDFRDADINDPIEAVVPQVQRVNRCSWADDTLPPMSGAMQLNCELTRHRPPKLGVG